MSKKGLYNKYTITKTDGTPTDPDAVYLVLRLDNNPEARLAARGYATHTRHLNPQFSKELYDLADQCTQKQYPED